MATKDDRRQAKGLLEVLETRVHSGPPIATTEIQSVRTFLSQHEFSPASDYFSRLSHIESRVHRRSNEAPAAPAKSNYGGDAAGYQMQVQSIYDHVILSTCYTGDFNGKHGRIKISHRFNEAGRIEFVELKYLRAFHPPLNGELRKLVTVKGYQALRKDWHQAEAFVLRVLPQELILLYADIFRCERAELLAWLVNIGHGLVDDLLRDLKTRRVKVPAAPHLSYSLSQRRNGEAESSYQGLVCHAVLDASEADAPSSPIRPSNPGSPQLPLAALLHDRVAVPILENVASLESAVEPLGDAEVLLRYVRRKL